MGARLALLPVTKGTDDADAFIGPGLKIGASGLSTGALCEVGKGGGADGVFTASEGSTRSSSPTESKGAASARLRRGLVSWRTLDVKGCRVGDLLCFVGSIAIGGFGEGPLGEEVPKTGPPKTFPLELNTFIAVPKTEDDPLPPKTEGADVELTSLPNTESPAGAGAAPKGDRVAEPPNGDEMTKK